MDYRVHILSKGSFGTPPWTLVNGWTCSFSLGFLLNCLPKLQVGKTLQNDMLSYWRALPVWSQSPSSDLFIFLFLFFFFNFFVLFCFLNLFFILFLLIFFCFVFLFYFDIILFCFVFCY